MINEPLLDILPILRKEYDLAKEKHPFFPDDVDALSIIMEEVGEVARAINDGEGDERIATEAAHVAVTAIRLMENIIGAEERYDRI